MRAEFLIIMYVLGIVSGASLGYTFAPEHGKLLSTALAEEQANCEMHVPPGQFCTASVVAVWKPILRN